MSIITNLSYAKINIGLKITGQRPDGYHTIQTIFQEISLADIITLEPISKGWQFTCNDNSIPADESNLCIKAYLSLKEHFPELGGVKIHLEKRIPVGAGLGGGSGNAATVLKGINKLHNLGLTDNKLEGIGLSLGADVPYYICGGTKYAEGIGEILSPCKLPVIKNILLVTPEISISTKWAYNEIKKHLTDDTGTSNFAPIHRDINSNIQSPMEKLFENDFESLIFQTYPEVGYIKKRLLESGAEFASLSGSGSTVFGIYNEETVAQNAQAMFSLSHQTFIAHPINR